MHIERKKKKNLWLISNSFKYFGRALFLILVHTKKNMMYLYDLELGKCPAGF